MCASDCPKPAWHFLFACILLALYHVKRQPLQVWRNALGVMCTTLLSEGNKTETLLRARCLTQWPKHDRRGPRDRWSFYSTLNWGNRRFRGVVLRENSFNFGIFRRHLLNGKCTLLIASSFLISSLQLCILVYLVSMRATLLWSDEYFDDNCSRIAGIFVVLIFYLDQKN